jgi:hypothetical protein
MVNIGAEFRKFGNTIKRGWKDNIENPINKTIINPSKAVFKDIDKGGKKAVNIVDKGGKQAVNVAERAIKFTPFRASFSNRPEDLFWPTTLLKGINDEANLGLGNLDSKGSLSIPKQSSRPKTATPSKPQPKAQTATPSKPQPKPQTATTAKTPPKPPTTTTSKTPTTSKPPTTITSKTPTQTVTTYNPAPKYVFK